ncbi:MAG TPA: hypothetical protein VN622_08325 [Clostridia bacterium]|nr:hypothetical protein [Clostridia bacterium]
MKHTYRRSTRTGLVRAVALLATIVSLLLLSSCNMRVNKGKNGEEKKVDIQTPFGGLKVRTDDVQAKDTGLPLYPGAVPKPKDGNDDDHKANVNLNFGKFGLKVVALSFTSGDSPDKVLEFYRNEMKKYGNTIECKGGSTGGFRMKKSDTKELSCEKADTNSQTIELKVGTSDRQRIVAVKPNGSGSEFSLVYVQTHGDEGEL